MDDFVAVMEMSDVDLARYAKAKHRRDSGRRTDYSARREKLAEWVKNKPTQAYFIYSRPIGPIDRVYPSMGFKRALSAVSFEEWVPKSDIMSNSRKRVTIEARQRLYWVLCREMKWSFRKAGRYIGRDVNAIYGGIIRYAERHGLESRIKPRGIVRKNGEAMALVLDGYKAGKNPTEISSEIKVPVPHVTVLIRRIDKLPFKASMPFVKNGHKWVWFKGIEMRLNSSRTVGDGRLWAYIALPDGRQQYLFCDNEYNA